ncbi:MAG TPA: molybdopterin molybdotransferase MoeA [Deltaproteobacteria bacterium]|jgi:molybdopterin molybdotransferase|nr:molybdopterin molybdotransferase MoeA [Deltaproteobacteria bacterium]
MISVEQARETILKRVAPLGSEKVYIEQALGRYLSEDVISEMDIPSWDNSAMDGYAVHTSDIVSPGIQLKVAYEIPAGSSPQGSLGRGSVVKVMTGAQMPPGADAVVKREDTEELDGSVIIRTIPKKSEHIRFKGEDIRKGEILLKQGTYLDPAQIGILASIRRVMVNCHRRPVVAIIATGDEVADLGEEITEGKIPSSNSYTLKSLVSQLGATPLYLGIAKDTKEDLRAKFSMARSADLILTSGGVSMGDYDVVKEVMAEEGNSMAFWKVEMKPGRPLAFGTINGVPTIGLPGNPVSTMTSFYQFARPAILKLSGSESLLLPRLRAKLACPVTTSGGRPHYIRGILSLCGEELHVAPTGPQGSGILSSMAKGNCFIVAPAERRLFEQGEWIVCEVFQASW